MHDSKIKVQFPNKHNFESVKSSCPISPLPTDYIGQIYKEEGPIKGTAVYLML